MGGKVIWGWSPSDVEKLMEVYEIKSQKEVMEIFPRRPWKNIWTKATALGLKRSNVARNGREHKIVIDLDVIDSEVKAYILGFISADGCLSKLSGNRIPALVIKLAIKDSGFLDNLRGIISPESKLHYSDNDTMVWFSIADRLLSEQLQKHGIIVRKTYRPVVPLTVPPELISHWVRGYFDGDGSITFGKRIDFPDCFLAGYKPPNGDNPILEFVNREFGKVYNHNYSVTVGQKGVSVIHYSGHVAVIFLHWIYENASIFMERKYNLAKRFLGKNLVDYTDSLNKRYWSTHEIDYLIQNINNKTHAEIGRSLGRNFSQVNAKIFDLRCEGKIPKYEKRGWTEEDLDFLTENYGNLPLKKIAEALNRPASSILSKVYSIRKGKVSHNKRRLWNQEELNILKEFYYRVPVKEIEELLPERSYKQIVTKVSHLKRTGQWYK